MPSQSPDISPPSISVNGRIVEASGQTDLPDGARMDFTAVRGDLDLSLTGSSSIVSHGRYDVVFDLIDWAPGEYVLWVEFWPGRGQSKAIEDKYGADGSKMSGGRVRNEPDSTELEWFGAYDFDLK